MAVVDDRRLAARARAFLAVLAAACYLTSLQGTFVLDDATAIVENPRIRRLWPPLAPLSAPPATTLAGRPLSALGFALTYAVGGLDPVPYHLANLAIHILAGWALFGLVRRTAALSPAVPRTLQANAAWIALFASAAWLLHPLQTEGVTYIVQRAESLAALLYLGVLYAFCRGTLDAGGRAWRVAAPAACAAGLLAKETVATAPIVALLYDRAFVSGSLREALRRNGRVHAALFATWAILAALLLGGYQTFGTKEAAATASPVGTLSAQAVSIARYLRLAAWPGPLCLDYGWPTSLPWRQALLPLAGVGLLLAVAGRLAARNTPAGFLLLSFFIILGPTSSVIPLGDALFEHRMYLPSAALAVAAAGGAYRLAARFPPRARWGAAWAGLLAVAFLGILTARRNLDYAHKTTLYASCLRVSPLNPRSHANLGKSHIQERDPARALAEHRIALAVAPGHAKTLGSLGALLAMLGRHAEAEAHLSRAVAAAPQDADMRAALSDVLAFRGRFPEAVAEYRKVLEVAPDHVPALTNAAWITATRLDGSPAERAEAVSWAERACGLAGEEAGAGAWDTLAAALAATGRFAEAADAAARGIEAARRLGREDLAGQIAGRADLYRKGLPFRAATAPASLPVPE